MRRWAFLLPMLVLIPAAASGQGPSKDSQTLQQLLAEVRQLRQDLQTTVVAVERAQILLYRVRSQQEAVTQASQRLDRARAELADTRSRQKQFAEQIKLANDALQAGTLSPADQKQEEEVLPHFKARLEALATEEQERQARESEADLRLRDEQAKLSDLQSQLDRLDAELQSAGQPRVNPPQ
jgi:chromosome segregation ATPase